MIPQSKWEWFGYSAHLCVGRWCRFHLATKVGKYLVSTVGSYIHPRHSAGSESSEAIWLDKNFPGEDIGSGYKFETMVFIAGPPCSESSCGCGTPTLGGDGSELDSERCNTPRDARANHMKLCLKWSKKKS